MASKAAVAWLGRSQLYSLAAVSTYGENTLLALNVSGYDPESGDVTVAVAMRDTAPDQQKVHTHANGYAYYNINRAGVIKPLTEEELANG